MTWIRRTIIRTSWVLLTLAITALIILGSLYAYMEIGLPSVAVLKDIQLQVPLKIYTEDGKLIGQYGAKLRTPVTMNQVPKQLIQAVLATEDQRFFEHNGVDFIGLVRAAKAVIYTGRKVQGASTITMQVARNFFLTRKKTYIRKFKEILLAFKINQELSKDKVLELYLNKIYFGQRAYGVGAAAQVYYGKSLDQLTLPQIAMIAGLPQAPSRNNPISNPKGALIRRNHVLWRMYQVGYIDQQIYQQAIQAPITAKYHGPKISINAPYIAEMVRAAMIDEFGKETAYTAGFKVYTTINSQDQQDANRALHDGLLAYDKRHGYRGPIQYLGQPNNHDIAKWMKLLQQKPSIASLQLAIVLEVQNQSVTAMLKNGKLITLPWSGLKWARKEINKNYLGPKLKHASDILKPGDLIRVQQHHHHWELSQVPEVEGAIIAMNPNNGAILALDGGFDFSLSHFNRAIQARRQAGSGFKPFIYSAALAKGYTLATLINDAPVVQAGFGENMLWRPHNDTYHFNGPTRLRVGLLKSVNLVSIRLLQQIGIHYTLNYVKRFGFNPSDLPHSLSLALGSATVTPMQMVTGYAAFANGGYKITPYFIEKIFNEENKVIYQAQPESAPIHNTAAGKLVYRPPLASQIITPQNAYLMTGALKSVITEGTGRQARVLHRSDLAGKTGTTNDQIDAWFNGFNRNIMTSVWVGFDQPRSLHEFGAQAALPIWIRFMKHALKGMPESNLTQPENIVSVRIDPKTGLLAYPGQNNAIFEVFRQHYAPTQYAANPAQQQGIFDTSSNLF